MHGCEKHWQNVSPKAFQAKEELWANVGLSTGKLLFIHEGFQAETAAEELFVVFTHNHASVDLPQS